jgi:hypothetical protein
MRFRP